MKTAEEYLEGKGGQDDIYEGAHVYTFGVVPGRFFDNVFEIVGI